jgi:nucleoside-diphosphate-sugar epimerase
MTSAASPAGTNAHKYTIIGANGFVGSCLASALGKEGEDYFAPVKEDPAVFTERLGNVFYCAGLTADFIQRPYDTVEAHVTFLSRLLERAAFDKLIYLSSTRLYDSQSGPISRESDDLILNPGNPRHLYDLSKALGEDLCLNFSDGRASVARLGSVYDSKDGAPGFLSALMQRLYKEREFILDSESGIVRDYIAVDDVVPALIKMAALPGKQLINVASGENISNQEIADILNIAGCKISFTRQTPKETRPLCEIKKLNGLGIFPISALAYLQKFMKDLE